MIDPLDSKSPLPMDSKLLESVGLFLTDSNYPTISQAPPILSYSRLRKSLNTVGCAT